MTELSSIYPNDRITLREVGLRDGLQLVKTWPDTVAKHAWIAAEYNAGVRHFEAGSFLPPSRFPQFIDVRDVVGKLAGLADAHSAALVLNDRGVEDALQTPVGEIGLVISATEEHSQANMRRSRADAVALVRKAAALRDETAPGKLVNAGIAMGFGCSISGAVDPVEVLRLAEECLDAGADFVGVADTVGYAGPRQVGAMAQALEKLCGDRPFLIHLHDTRAMGVANATAAIDNGARILDASLGGLGGCPFAPGATGNVVFEDLIFLCETMGFATGIDLEKLKEARAIAEGAMPQENFHGALTKAGAPRNMQWRAA